MLAVDGNIVACGPRFSFADVVLTSFGRVSTVAGSHAEGVRHTGS